MQYGLSIQAKYILSSIPKDAIHWRDSKGNVAYMQLLHNLPPLEKWHPIFILHMLVYVPGTVPDAL